MTTSGHRLQIYSDFIDDGQEFDQDSRDWSETGLADEVDEYMFMATVIRSGSSAALFDEIIHTGQRRVKFWTPRRGAILRHLKETKYIVEVSAPIGFDATVLSDFIGYFVKHCGGMSWTEDGGFEKMPRRDHPLAMRRE